MRDGLGVLLVAAGLAWAVLTNDKLGLVIAFFARAMFVEVRLS